MNRTIVPLLVALIATAGLLTLFFLQGSTAPDNQENQLPYLALNCSLPNTPEKIPNLKIENRGLTSGQVSAIAKNVFNLIGPVSEKYSGFTIEEGTNSLTIYQQGGFIYRNGRFPQGEYSAPSEEEAMSAAKGFLEKLKINALVPSHPSIEIGEPEVSELTTIGSTTQVGFGLKFENLPVGKISINVGEGGEIWGALGDWREIKPEGYINIMSIDKALELLPEGLIHELERELEKYDITSFPSIRKITVQDVSIEYYSKWLSEPQDYLWPIYLFRFEIEWSGKHPCPYGRYYAALSAINGEYIYGLSLTGIS